MQQKRLCHSPRLGFIEIDGIFESQIVGTDQFHVQGLAHSGLAKNLTGAHVNEDSAFQPSGEHKGGCVARCELARQPHPAYQNKHFLVMVRKYKRGQAGGRVLKMVFPAHRKEFEIFRSGHDAPFKSCPGGRQKKIAAVLLVIKKKGLLPRMHQP